MECDDTRNTLMCQDKYFGCDTLIPSVSRCFWEPTIDEMDQSGGFVSSLNVNIVSLMAHVVKPPPKQGNCPF